MLTLSPSRLKIRLKCPNTNQSPFNIHPVFLLSTVKLLHYVQSYAFRNIKAAMFPKVQKVNVEE